jgi:UDP-N-acetylglucosamine pyrophosphorylase
LIKLGADFKKVSQFQKRIPSIPKILELDHLTITGNVNLARGVTLKGKFFAYFLLPTIDFLGAKLLPNRYGHHCCDRRQHD